MSKTLKPRIQREGLQICSPMIDVALHIASPWILLAYYLRFERLAITGLATIAIIAGATLFYQSNGAMQINAQRYTLNWLTILLVLMVRGAQP